VGALGASGIDAVRLADWTTVDQGSAGAGPRVPGLVNAFDALVICGGDTAFEILPTLERTVLGPIREIVPGAGLARALGSRDLIIMTKAGAFGLWTS
jgi:uncharacterized protein YgbK (DUF1537 family)